uniref:Uncharacterized protein n=1 Tax=Arundo donax TaxID=35708 RepID=A0A0A9HKP4_ARUDO
MPGGTGSPSASCWRGPRSARHGYSRSWLSSATWLTSSPRSRLRS